MKLHPSVTQERIMERAIAGMYGLDNPGICRACGEDQEGCEPDAEHYTCECCDANEVFGAEQLLIMYGG